MRIALCVMVFMLAPVHVLAQETPEQAVSEETKKEIADLRSLVQQLSQQIAMLAAQQKTPTPTPVDVFTESKRAFIDARDSPIVKACHDKAVKGRALVAKGQFLGCILER